MANSISKLAYQTLQQGKSIAGLAHKQLSTRLMELVAPEAMPGTTTVSAELMNELRASITALQDRDWLEAEQGIYPTELLFEAPWLDWLSRYPLLWLDLPPPGNGDATAMCAICPSRLIQVCIPTITFKTSTIKPMVI